MIVVLYPFFYDVYLTFFDYSLLGFGETKFVGFNNYLSLFSDPTYANAWYVSLVWTIGSLIFQLIIGVPLAFLVNQKLRGRSIVRSFLILPWILPPVVTAILWKVILYSPHWGIFNYFLSLFGVPQIIWLGDTSTAMGSIIAVNVWYGFPLIMIIVLAGLQSIPASLYDASKVDGASALQTLRYVTLPSLRVFIGIIVLLRFIWIFQFFDIPWLMTQGGPIYTTMVLPALTYLDAFSMFRLSIGATIALTMALFLFLWIFVYIRYVQKR
jgi:ABC-type sugar transport system permease subunit